MEMSHETHTNTPKYLITPLRPHVPTEIEYRRATNLLNGRQGDRSTERVLDRSDTVRDRLLKIASLHLDRRRNNELLALDIRVAGVGARRRGANRIGRWRSLVLLNGGRRLGRRRATMDLLAAFSRALLVAALGVGLVARGALALALARGGRRGRAALLASLLFVLAARFVGGRRRHDGFIGRLEIRLIHGLRVVDAGIEAWRNGRRFIGRIVDATARPITTDATRLGKLQ